MEKYVEFEAFVKSEGNTAYAACKDFNALCKVDIQTGTSTFISVFDEKLFEKRLYVFGVHNNGRIYFAPSAACRLAIYDIGRSRMSYVDIRIIDKVQYPCYNPKLKFNGAIVHNGYIFLLPCTYPAIARFNMASGYMDYFDEWLPDSAFTFRKSWCVVNNKVYMTSDTNNIVLEFDLNNCNGRTYCVGDNNHGCWGICSFEEDIWLSPRKPGPVIRWNPSSGKITEYGKYPVNFNGRQFLFTKIYPVDSMINLIPAKSNMPLCIDLNGKSDRLMQNKNLDVLKNQDNISFLFEMDNMAYLKIKNAGETKYLMLDLINCNYRPLPFVLENWKYYEQIIYTYAEGRNRIRYENAPLTLSDFVRYL